MAPNGKGKQLTDAKVRNLKHSGRKTGAENSLLNTTGRQRALPSGQSREHKKLAALLHLAGKTHEIGLGSYSDVPLAKAREFAAAKRLLLSQGIDPIDARSAEGAEK